MPNLFEFKPGKTLAHRLDPRCKFFLLCIISAGLVAASWSACLALLILILLELKSMGIRPLDLLRQLWAFMLFLLLIIFVRGLTEPGPQLFTLVVYPISISVSIPGLTQGGLVALRFFTVMVLGLVFSAGTRPSDLKAAVQWILSPVPFIPEKRVGMMISLALRFLPMILTQTQESRQAIQARCGNLEKNPLKRMSTLVLALLGKTFKNAEDLISAMEARCYTQNRTDPTFQPNGTTPVALAAGICIFLTLIFLP